MIPADDEHLRKVNRRLRKDLKKAVSVARSWKDRYLSLTFCTDASHRSYPPSPPLPRHYGHAWRYKK